MPCAGHSGCCRVATGKLAYCGMVIRVRGLNGFQDFVIVCKQLLILRFCCLKGFVSSAVTTGHSKSVYVQHQSYELTCFSIYADITTDLILPGALNVCCFCQWRAGSWVTAHQRLGGICMTTDEFTLTRTCYCNSMNEILPGFNSLRFMTCTHCQACALTCAGF